MTISEIVRENNDDFKMKDNQDVVNDTLEKSGPHDSKDHEILGI